MKVIDLLNKIAKGEEVPDAIKWCCHDFEWFVYEYKTKGELGEPTLLDYLSQCPQMLNDEIITFYKIKEENKKPEKLDVDEEEKGKYIIWNTEFEQCTTLEMKIIKRQDYIIRKINEIIDYLKSKGE